MRVSYTSYEKAPLATAVSFLGRTVGTLMMVGGVMALFSGEVLPGIVIAALGFGIGLGAELLSEKMAESSAFRRWWKQVKDANLELQIASSLNTAVEIYNKNPQQRTLDKIAALNPAAAEYIRNNRK